MKIKPTTADAMRLLMEGQMTFARMEHHGIRVNTVYLDKAIQRMDRKAERLKVKLQKTQEWKLWQREFGAKANLGADAQLGKVLVQLGHQLPLTASGRPQVSQEVLKRIDLPFLKLLDLMGTVKRVRGTFLEGIRKETVDGYLHSMFSLNTARSMRGSSQLPNFQNFPNRDERWAKVVRRCFIPRDGCKFIEADFGAHEWVMAANFWQDSVMLEYAADESKDIHRDQAAAMFLCDPSLINKATRYLSKNGFVFPKLYGSYYVQIARAVWGELDGKVVGDVPVKDWLASKGIKELGACDPKSAPRRGTFEQHIKSVEDGFERRFRVFARKKEDWWQQYRRTGCFRMLTGFVIEGHGLSKNAVMNYPIQGVAFHCLLKVLILLDRWLRKRKFKTVIVGQIHDSLLLDAIEDEIDDVVFQVKDLMTQRLPELWPWLTIPPKAELEIAHPNWYMKTKLEAV